MTENPYASPEHGGETSGRKKWLGATLLKLLAALGALALLVCLLLPATRSAGPAARRAQCSNNLKQIALGLLHYESTWHCLPPAYTVDEEGRPLHSWRTLILPHMDYEPLYKTIDLTKAWNDPANAEAYNTAISCYQCPEARGPANHTTYLAVVAPGGCFLPREPRLLSEITDDHSATLMVIDVASAHTVPWMSPTDADEKLVNSFRIQGESPHAAGANAAFVDGSVHFLVHTVSDSWVRALISIAGNDDRAAKNSDD